MVSNQNITGRKQAAFTILEMLVAVVFLGIMLGIAVSNLRVQADPLSIATTNLEGFLKQMRARAISSTLAYTINPTSSGYLQTRYSSKCSDTTKTVDSKYFLKLPTTVTFGATTWSFCYSSRGFPDANIQVTLRNTTANSQILEIMLGGAVRLL